MEKEQRIIINCKDGKTREIIFSTGKTPPKSESFCEFNCPMYLACRKCAIMGPISDGNIEDTDKEYKESLLLLGWCHFITKSITNKEYLFPKNLHEVYPELLDTDIDLEVSCKDGKKRSIHWKIGIPGNDEILFCERNCSLYEKCDKVKNPEKVDLPQEDTLQAWCADQKVVSDHYYPSNIQEVYPELFQ